MFESDVEGFMTHILLDYFLLNFVGYGEDERVFLSRNELAGHNFDVRLWGIEA